jgi:hypothetical protein
LERSSVGASWLIVLEVPYQSHPYKSRLNLEQPEAFPEPIRYSGESAYFYINNAVAQQLPPRYPFSFPT